MGDRDGVQVRWRSPRDRFSPPRVFLPRSPWFAFLDHHLTTERAPFALVHIGNDGLVLVLVLVFARAQSLPIFNRCISRLLPARASFCTAAPTAGHSWLPRHYGFVIC